MQRASRADDRPVEPAPQGPPLRQPGDLAVLAVLAVFDRQVPLARSLNRRNSKNSKGGEGIKLRLEVRPPGIERGRNLKCPTGTQSKYSNFLAGQAPKSELL